MNLTKVSALLIGGFLTRYAFLRWHGHLNRTQIIAESPSFTLNKPVAPVRSIYKSADQVPDHGIKKALFAYDTGDHKTLMNVRFDQQTVDTLNKFKLATGVDMSKFVAFSVRHLLNTYPEFKNIIIKYLNRTQL